MNRRKFFSRLLAAGVSVVAAPSAILAEVKRPAIRKATIRLNVEHGIVRFDEPVFASCFLIPNLSCVRPVAMQLVPIKVDASSLQAATSELVEQIAKLPDGVVGRIRDRFVDLPLNPRALVDIDTATTGGAVVVTVRPSDLMLEFLAAVRAGKIDR